MGLFKQLSFVVVVCCHLAACGGGDSKNSGTANGNTETSPPKTSAAAELVVDEFNEAQVLWANTAPSNYHYTYKEGAQGYKFDSYSPLVITVRDGKISQVLSGVTLLDPKDYKHASIEQIFSRIAYTVAHSNAGTVFFAEYDPLLGYPSVFKTTSGCCDSSMQLEISDFQIDP